MTSYLIEHKQQWLKIRYWIRVYSDSESALAAIQPYQKLYTKCPYCKSNNIHWIDKREYNINHICRSCLKQFNNLKGLWLEFKRIPLKDILIIFNMRAEYQESLHRKVILEEMKIPIARYEKIIEFYLHCIDVNRSNTPLPKMIITTKAVVIKKRKSIKNREHRLKELFDLLQPESIINCIEVGKQLGLSNSSIHAYLGLLANRGYITKEFVVRTGGNGGRLLKITKLKEKFLLLNNR